MSRASVVYLSGHEKVPNFDEESQEILAKENCLFGFQTYLMYLIHHDTMLVYSIIGYKLYITRGK